jgi:xylulokinase
LIGVKIGHDRGDLFRAQLESLALWTRHNRDKMQELTGNSCDRLVMLGGTARLELLAQLKADALGIPVHVPGLEEGAAVGAALLAGLGCGVFNTPSDAWGSLRYEEKVYPPDENRHSWYTDLYEQAYKPLYSALCDIHHTMRDLELGRDLS